MKSEYTVAMRFGDWWNTVLDIIFPTREGSVDVSTLSAESFAGHISLWRDHSLGATAILPYRSPLVRGAVHALKYRHQEKVGAIFGTLLHETLFEDIADWHLFGEGEPLLVIPIPLSKERFRERGYNQTLLIAKTFCQGDSGLRLADSVLQKIKDTPSQATREDKRARIHNLQGAFAVKDPGVVRGKTIILIDDVITTGATMREASSALKKAGARSVYMLAVAH